MDKITTRRFLSQTKKFDIQLDRIMMRRDYYKKQKYFFEFSLDDTTGIDDCIEAVSQIINDLFKNRAKIEKALSKINDVERRFVLEKHFLHDMSTDDLAEEIGYSKRQIERIIEIGILECGEYFDCV